MGGLDRKLEYSFRFVAWHFVLSSRKAKAEERLVVGISRCLFAGGFGLDPAAILEPFASLSAPANSDVVSRTADQENEA